MKHIDSGGQTKQYRTETQKQRATNKSHEQGLEICTECLGEGGRKGEKST